MKPVKFEITEDIINIIDDIYDADKTDYEREIEAYYNEEKYFIEIKFRLVIYGYNEHNTGQKVCTGLHLDLHSVGLWDSEGDPLECKYDEEQIENHLKEF